MIILDGSSISNALVGGLLIGLAASTLILTNGKIAGISGILGGILHFDKNDMNWRILFILGLILSPLIFEIFRPLPQLSIFADNRTLLLAGLLVGMGTRLGSGCTSGHGVCGIARLSRRSFVATLCFILSGILTVYLSHYYRV